MCNFWVGVHFPDYTQHWVFFCFGFNLGCAGEPANGKSISVRCCLLWVRRGAVLIMPAMCKPQMTLHSARDTTRALVGEMSFQKKQPLCSLLLWERTVSTAEGTGRLYTQQSRPVQAAFSNKPPRADSLMESPCCYQWRQSQMTSLTPAFLRKNTDGKTERRNISLRMGPHRFCWHPSELSMAMATGRAELLVFIVCLPL